MKTGSTSTAKFCLSATATRNGVDLIAVVMASDDSKTRIKDASALLDYGFSNCQVMEDITTSKEIGKISVEKGKKETVPYPEKIKTKVTRIKSDGGKLTKEIKIKTVKAPIKKGQTVGKIVYKDGNTIAAETEIKASENIEKMDYLSSLQRVVGEYF